MAKKKSNMGGAREGAGRPVLNPEGKAVLVTASVPEGLMTQLNALAESKSWGRSKAVTEAIRAYVARKKR